MYYHGPFSAMLIIISLISNIIINYYYSNVLNIEFNILSMFFNLVGYQILASRNIIKLYPWLLLGFGCIILGSIFMTIQYYLQNFTFFASGEICKILFCIIGMYIWAKYTDYIKSSTYLYPILILLIVIAITFGYYEILNLYYTNNTKETKYYIIDTFIFITSIYPMILLSLRFFNSWYSLVIFMSISAILQIIYDYPFYFFMNNINIIFTLLILFSHYPKTYSRRTVVPETMKFYKITVTSSN